MARYIYKAPRYAEGQRVTFHGHRSSLEMVGWIRSVTTHYSRRREGDEWEQGGNLWRAWHSYAIQPEGVTKRGRSKDCIHVTDKHIHEVIE